MSEGQTQARADQVAQAGKWERDLSAKSTAHAVKFSSDAIKLTTLINSGGLIAMPAAVALFKIDASVVTGPMLYSGIFFVSGIVFSAAATFIAYFAICVYSDSLLSSAYRIQWQMLEVLDGSKRQETIDNLTKETRGWKTYRKLRKAGIATVIASYLAFIAGVVWGVMGIQGAR